MRGFEFLLFASTALAAPQSNLEELFKRQNSAGLDTLFKKAGKKYFGTCADSALLSRSANADVIKANFGQLTPENR